jgi:hypothetical protein
MQEYMLKNHDPDTAFIVTMAFCNKPVNWGATAKTLGYYIGDNATYMVMPGKGKDLNPYQPSKIGTMLMFKGRKCVAENCDHMKAKHDEAVDCTDCGASAESC